MRFKKCSGVSHLFVLKDPNILISCSLNAQNLPSKHLLVFRTSWRRLQDMSWRYLQNMSWRCLQDMSWRCVQDMSWRCLQHVNSVTTSWRRLWRRKIVTLKTSSRRLEDMPWRSLGGKQNVYCEYLYLANLYLYLINLYLTYLDLKNKGESKMH